MFFKKPLKCNFPCNYRLTIAPKAKHGRQSQREQKSSLGFQESLKIGTGWDVDHSKLNCSFQPLNNMLRTPVTSDFAIYILQVPQTCYKGRGCLKFKSVSSASCPGFSMSPAFLFRISLFELFRIRIHYMIHLFHSFLEDDSGPSGNSHPSPNVICCTDHSKGIFSNHKFRFPLKQLQTRQATPKLPKSIC